MSELHRTLTTYKMRVIMEKSELKKRHKGKEHKVHQNCSNIESDKNLAQYN